MRMTRRGRTKIDVPLEEEGVRLDEGNQKFMLGDYRGAITDYSKAIALCPNNAIAFYSKGLACLGMGQKHLAKKYLTKSRELGYRVPQEALDLCV
jgi:Flp pilus assembly protein TadD